MRMGIKFISLFIFWQKHITPSISQMKVPIFQYNGRMLVNHKKLERQFYVEKSHPAIVSKEIF
ncbi:MAG: hypothetical protein H6Q68_3753 [Firmicutes bacterium]|nr:hypothetical protein [Bacillota bacterium]